MLKGKKVILGVTGSIAAYKSAQLIRLLVKEGSYVGIGQGVYNAANFGHLV